jgi:flagellar biosynthesis chaperone FliJ
MPQTQATALDRFNDALRNIDERLQELRENLEDRRKRFEGEIRDRAEKIETELRKNSLYRRVDQARKDLEEQATRARSQVYQAFGLATKSEVDKLHRKLNAVSRKVNELAKEHAVEL